MKPWLKKISYGSLLVLACVVLACIVAFTVWRIRLASEIDRQLAAIRAAGLPTNGEEANAYYTNVPPNENAAEKLADVFAMMANYPDQRSNEVNFIKFPSRKESFPSDKLDLLRGYCEMNSNTLTQASEAVKLPRSRYPLDLNWGAATPLPHLRPLKLLAQLEEDQSVLAPKDAAGNIATIIGLAHTLDTEPVLISKMVRISLLSMAVQDLEHHLNSGGFNDADLQLLSRSFSGSEQTNQVVNGIIGERAIMIRYFRMSLAEAQQYANQGDDNSSPIGGPPVPGPRPPLFKVSGFMDRDLRFYLAAMQTNIWFGETHQHDLPLITNLSAQMTDQAKQKLCIFSAMLLPAAGNLYFKEARSLAQIRTAEAALAIERYRASSGTLPDSLAALVPEYLPAVPEDPYDSQPLRYKKLEHGYVVYSVDRDGEDNGGKERPPDAKSTDKTPYDITFTVER